MLGVFLWHPQVQPFLAHQHASISSSSSGSGPTTTAAAAAPQSLPSPQLDFSDSSQVFSMRSTGELLRMYAVLKVRAASSSTHVRASGQAVGQFGQCHLCA